MHALIQHSKLKRQPGFTLIETMVVVAISAVLLMLAVPSFQDAQERNRVRTQITSFVSALNTARIEAIRRGSPVTMCISTNGTSCLAANANWGQGWIIFADPANIGVRDAGETLVRVYPAVKSMTFTATSALGKITFGGTGIPINNFVQATFTSKSTANATKTCAVTVALSGRASNKINC